MNLFENKLKATEEELNNLMVYKNKTAMDDSGLKKFIEQKEEKMLKRRRNKLKSSIAVFRFYTDAESVSGSELDSESTSDLSDSSSELDSESTGYSSEE